MDKLRRILKHKLLDKFTFETTQKNFGERAGKNRRAHAYCQRLSHLSVSRVTKMGLDTLLQFIFKFEKLQQSVEEAAKQLFEFEVN